MNDPSPIAATEADGVYAEMRSRVAGTNINATTLLATDYLNHFNEIIMLIELLPEAPECIEDCRAWQFLGYVEHFQQSSIANNDLAVEAYVRSPAKYREPFDSAVEEMSILAQGAIEDLGKAVADNNGDLVRQIAQEISQALRERVQLANAIIHGSADTLLQSQIDDILGVG